MLTTILSPVYLTVSNRLLEIGDSILSSGTFAAHAASTNMAFRAWNANNHQLTWGVLLAAIRAVSNYMMVENAWGDAEFDIYDGGIQVGRGVISGP